MNANFINDGMDFEAFLAVLKADDRNMFDTFEIADDSTQSNAYVRHNEGRPAYCLSKVRIKAGKEITITYGSNHWYSYIINDNTFSDEIRVKSLLMLWTEYEKSPREIPLTNARWIDYYGCICNTPDLQTPSDLTLPAIETLWKDVTKTLMRCIAYLGLEQSEPADAFIMHTLQLWHRRLDEQAMKAQQSHLTSSKITIENFWFSVKLLKRQSR